MEPGLLPAEFVSTLPPYAHQTTALVRSWRKRRYALFMEQGTGKTKVLYDTAQILYRKGVINAMLVLAPNDVHDQWIDEQLPLHWPRDIPARTVVWDTGRPKSKREAMELSSRPLPDRMTILSMNHDALAHASGFKAAMAFMCAYNAMLVVDESHNFKTPKAARTRNINKVARLAVIKRIATGTGKTQSPFDFWAQFRILDQRILGFDSFLAFKHRYGEWSKNVMVDKNAPLNKDGTKPLREYETLNNYANLDELYTRIEPHCFRVMKEDCLDLPPKVNVLRYTRLSPEQRDLYQRVKDEGILLLERVEAGEKLSARDVLSLSDEELLDLVQNAEDRVSASIKLTMFLRLHQVLGGFLKDDNRKLHVVDGTPDKCPRIATALEYVNEALDSSKAKVIVWAAFRAELGALHKLIPNSVLVDGSVTGGKRREAIEQFKNPKSATRVLVAHARTMGTGQNLTVAGTALYYSNPWSWVLRAQSEDRIHRIGQKGSATIVDIRARGVELLDTKILNNLKGHGDMAREFMTFDSKKLKEVL